MPITIGTDPEFFVENIDTKQLIDFGVNSISAVPAFYALGIRDPNNPKIKLPAGEVTPDGLAVEFTVMPTSDIRKMLEYLRLNIVATSRLLTCGELTVNPRAYVDQKFIDSLTEEFGKACSLQVLGCDPDYNVYGMDIPDKPNPKKHNYRTSGGHIHLEVGKEFIKDQAAVCYLVAMLDNTLGSIGTFWCSSYEARLRKEQYGYPGMVRTNPKLGTLEYRTLPSQALVQTPAKAKIMFSIAQRIGTWCHDIFYTEPNQQKVIADFANVVGEFDDVMSVATNIVNHNTDACLHQYLKFSDHKCPESLPIRRYNDDIMDVFYNENPTDFKLRGWM